MNSNWTPYQADLTAGTVPLNGPDPNANSDWRSQLQPEARHRIVNEILDTLRRHLPVPVPGPEDLSELNTIAVGLEEKIYSAATSQPDYLRKTSLKMLSMETKSQGPQLNPGVNPSLQNQNRIDPGGGGMQSQSSTDHTYSLAMAVMNQPPTSRQMQQQQQETLIPQNLQNNSSASLQSTPNMPTSKNLSIPSANQCVTPGMNTMNNNNNNLGPESNGSLQTDMYAAQRRQQVPQQQQQQQLQQLLYQQQLMRQKLRQQQQQTPLRQQLLQQQQQQQRVMQDVASSSASMDSAAQTSAPSELLVEEMFQKVKSMKEQYFMDLREIYQRLSMKLSQIDPSLMNDAKAAEQIEKMKNFKNVLERMLNILQLNKQSLQHQVNIKDKLHLYEKQIINILQSHKKFPQQQQQEQQQQMPLSQPGPSDPQQQPQTQQIGNHQLQQNGLQQDQINNISIIQQNGLQQDQIQPNNGGSFGVLYTISEPRKCKICKNCSHERRKD